jgi:hypothetical protein
MSTLSAILLVIVTVPSAFWLYRVRANRIDRQSTRASKEAFVPESASDDLIGHSGVVSSDVLTSREGRVSLALSAQEPQTYEARLPEGDRPLTHGAPVLVIDRLDGLTLSVVADELPLLEDHRE